MEEGNSLASGVGAKVSAAVAPPLGAGRTQPAGLLEAPRLLANGIEVSLHACTRSMVREVRHIFPHLSAASVGGGALQGAGSLGAEGRLQRAQDAAAPIPDSEQSAAGCEEGQEGGGEKTGPCS